MRLTAADRKKIINGNPLDRMISYFSPVSGRRRQHARLAMAMINSWSGASRSRRTLRGWITGSGDADTDTLGDLPDLRSRSHDLLRDNPVANSIINTNVTSIVGSGLMLRSQIDRSILGLSKAAATAWQRKTEAEWRLFSGKEIDLERTLNFSEIQDLALRSTLESGDVFVTTPNVKRHGSPYTIRLQLIEADRICNKNFVQDNENLVSGIEKDSNGAPKFYHILNNHPGSLITTKNEWKKIRVFGASSGRRRALHLYLKRRVGLSRGVPVLAPVIEEIKQLGRYNESEVERAVVSSFFTAFIKTLDSAGLNPMEMSDGTEAPADPKNYKMSAGAILDLAPGEDVTFADPTAPNPAAEKFIQVMIMQIGMAVEIPYEILVKRFQSSYSASKGSMLEAWRYFMARRKWLSDNLCRPVYELFLDEAVALGRIVAPGYLTGDPLVRAAYLAGDWVGPARGDTNEVQQAVAATKRVDLGISTRSREAASITGADWENVHDQNAEEHRRRIEDGLEEPAPPPAVVKP